MSRSRLAALAVAAAMLVACLEAQEATARIKIDTDRAIGEVHEHLFGNFAEHLGRMIYAASTTRRARSPMPTATARTRRCGEG